MSTNRLLDYLGLQNIAQLNYNQTAAELVEQTLARGEGALADNGGLCVATGEFTGRSPKDKFVVKDASTEDHVWWGEVNQPFDPDDFQNLKRHILSYLQNRELWVRDAYAGADPDYRIGVRVINENPWQNLFVHNMFIRPSAAEEQDFTPDWTVIAAPGFHAEPALHNTRQHNFTIINFTERTVLIGGSAYTGEIKKGIFTVLNYMLPFQEVLPMHCSANMGPNDDVAVFFGLSGTGKTTLSADPERALIGDDEHGWTENGVFNFEGGCYAKVIDLSAEKEPQIWEALRFQTLIENTSFFDETRRIDFKDTDITQNTRAAYPIYHIPEARIPSVGDIPQNVFMLTADAFGVLPPIAKLDAGQAMYHFLSGYTAKVAGTEAGVKEPQATFSACFGLPFLPLHPTRYADMLGDKMRQHNVNVWLVNTGWTGGPYGVGERINLPYTRAMVRAALRGDLNEVSYEPDPVFGLQMPTTCPDVPDEVLNPRETWSDKAAYDEKANQLAGIFNKNFGQYADYASEEIKAAAPKELQK